MAVIHLVYHFTTLYYSEGLAPSTKSIIHRKTHTAPIEGLFEELASCWNLAFSLRRETNFNKVKQVAYAYPVSG